MKMRPGILLLMLLSGCATVGTRIPAEGTPITAANNHIQMPHYSVTLPADQGWFFRPPTPTVSSDHEEVSIAKKDPPFTIGISMIRQTVLSDRLRAMNDHELANDYRRHEKAGLIVLGVIRGEYRLESVVRGEAKIGDKEFYTMSFMKVRTSTVTNQVMYLFIPKPKGNTWFIHAQYGVIKPKNITADATESVKTVFENVLKTLVVRSGNAVK